MKCGLFYSYEKVVHLSIGKAKVGGTFCRPKKLCYINAHCCLIICFGYVIIVMCLRMKDVKDMSGLKKLLSSSKRVNKSF